MVIVLIALALLVLTHFIARKAGCGPRWCTALTLLVLPLTVVFCLVTGVRFNITVSAPKGLYRLVALQPDERLTRGDWIVIDSQWDREGQQRGIVLFRMPLLKRIAALEGDQISLAQNREQNINGVSQGPRSRPLFRDSTGKEMPHLTFPVTVPPQSVWVLSDHSQGWDSRYFGSVPREVITHRANLLLSW